MHAYQPQRQPQPTPTPRKRPRRSPQRSQQQARREKAVFLEMSAKISVNCLLFSVAIATITRLLPYHLTQQEKLGELRAEVAQAEIRVGKLRQDFTKNFDPYDSPQLRQEHSAMVDPNQRRVIWVDPSNMPKPAPQTQP